MMAFPFLLALTTTTATAAAQKPPDTVFLEDLTWDEIRDRITAGATSVIVATAGTEQKGPHMVMGQHRWILEHTTDRIARALGNALVAPIITYVPEGRWDPPSGHMRMAGTITLPDDRFMALLEHAATSLAAGGFRDVIFLGDSGGNQNGMRAVAAKLNQAWAGTGRRAHFIGDYYAKSAADTERYVTQELGIGAENIGGHAGMSDTSQMMAVNMAHIRSDRLAPGGGFDGSGVSGDPTRASPELGRRILRFKVDNAVAEIRAAVPGPVRDVAVPAPSVAPTAPSRAIEELTWTEVRDALAAGTTTVIVPIGGTEQNGPHMVTGKHNYIVTFAAKQIAERLGNALVAPTIQYVPQGDPGRPGFGDRPGVISNPSPAYDALLDAAARSLAAHGFTRIVLIGDSGGNQGGMTAVADSLNAEWRDGAARVFALTDYYRRGQEHARAWLQAQYGWDAATIGSHAGITDTSAMMFVHPDGVRAWKIQPFGGGPEMGVRGDPSRATPAIGRMVVAFKVNAALAQLEALAAGQRDRPRD